MRLCWAICVLIIAGCGGAPADLSPPKAPGAATTASASSPAGIEGQAAAATPPASAEQAANSAVPPPAASAGPITPAVDDETRRPATVAEAAAVLDLRTFPLMPGAKPPGLLQVAGLAYAVAGDEKSAFEFQRKNLLERGWKELSEPQIFPQSASGQFGKSGFHVSVSVTSAGEPGQVGVRLINHSNLNLRKAPVPAGAKEEYSFPAVASFVTTASAAETAAALKKLLLDKGWQFYGTAGETLIFKQNAVELSARVFEPPAQPGRTSISFTAQQLSADLPAPADADRVQYVDDNKRLDVDAPGSPADLAAFYKTALAPAGWKHTTDNPIQDGFESFMIFRNAEKDMLTLTLRDLAAEKKTRLHLVHQSAAEVEEEERRAKEALAAKKKKEDDKRNTPLPKVAVTLPAGASEVQASAREIEFQLPSGKAKAAVDALAKELASAGWKVDDPAVGDAMGGQLSFKKGEHSLSILYIDPGVIPAEITISASGVELERAGGR